MPKKTLNEYKLERAEQIEQLAQLRAIIKAIDPDGTLTKAVYERLYNEHPAFARQKAHHEAYKDFMKKLGEVMSDILGTPPEKATQVSQKK